VRRVRPAPSPPLHHHILLPLQYVSMLRVCRQVLQMSTRTRLWPPVALPADLCTQRLRTERCGPVRWQTSVLLCCAAVPCCCAVLYCAAVHIVLLYIRCCCTVLLYGAAVQCCSAVLLCCAAALRSNTSGVACRKGPGLDSGTVLPPAGSRSRGTHLTRVNQSNRQVSALISRPRHQFCSCLIQWQ
jgi:hypothetical protein